MKTQVRFSALGAANPSAASALFTKTVLDAKNRFYNYARLAGQEEKIRAKLEKSHCLKQNLNRWKNKENLLELNSVDQSLILKSKQFARQEELPERSGVKKSDRQVSQL